MTRILLEEVKVVNIGITEFMQSLSDQGVQAVHVDWTPPSEEDGEIEALLEDLL
jgi:hypothetical protein